MRYLKETLVALAAVRDASRAARSLQTTISATKAAYQKVDVTGAGHGSVSPVTAADFMVQALVLGSLANAFPNDRFIAEESGKDLMDAGAATRAAVMSAIADHAGDTSTCELEVVERLDLGVTGLADEWSRTQRTWVLDPIDGTKGFLRGDQFAVALSLLEGGAPVLGLLGCPALGESGSLFYAAQGAGAYMGSTHGAASEAFSTNDADAVAAVSTRIQVSPEQVGAGLVRCEAFEAGHSDHDLAARVAARLGCSGTPPVRMDGQGKYGVLAKGAGHVYTRLPRAGYVENIWDHAAGAVLIEEAGGRVSDLEGNPLDFSQGAKLSASVRGIVASNGVVHEALLEALAAEADG